ncbi:hypothetical protein D3Z56_07440 [Lachnospiraceae bacterium]|nr:hypothetical protein [Lachnospiraceae bacterium]
MSKMTGGRLEHVLERITNNSVKAVLLGAGVIMCATGSVTVGAALPVIMGQNIGTCVTALFSSVGTNRNARRASHSHKRNCIRPKKNFQRKQLPKKG